MIPELFLREEMVRFVAYYRVSTAKQERSGLGLAAQQRKIFEFITSQNEIIAEFCDIQSGRHDSRVELQKALALAKRESAKLIIARLDRFSRRVSFIANIMEQGIGIDLRRNAPVDDRIIGQLLSRDTAALA